MRWNGKYHVVIVPKHRKKRLYRKFRIAAGQIVAQRCQQEQIELVEKPIIPDHIHIKVDNDEAAMLEYPASLILPGMPTKAYRWKRTQDQKRRQLPCR